MQGNFTLDDSMKFEKDTSRKPSIREAKEDDEGLDLVVGSRTPLANLCSSRVPHCLQTSYSHPSPISSSLRSTYGVVGVIEFSFLGSFSIVLTRQIDRRRKRCREGKGTPKKRL